MRYLLGKLLHWVRMPGFIRPFQYRDLNSGRLISVRTSPQYTILSIDGKELFFIRETGKFDGIGEMAVDLPPAQFDCVQPIAK